MTQKRCYLCVDSTAVPGTHGADLQSQPGEAEPQGLQCQYDPDSTTQNANDLTPIILKCSETLGVTLAREGRSGQVTSVLDSAHGEAGERTLRTGAPEQPGQFPSLPG